LLRGYYTAASGMLSQQRRQDILTNNMANALTPGYKADQTTMRAFPELLIHQLGQKQLPVKNNVKLAVMTPIGTLNTGVYLQETIPLFTQGDVRDTGMSTDMAIWNGQLPDETGFLFFSVQNENGAVNYTRNGNFTVDPDGYLVTTNGHYVLDANGNPIWVGQGDFSVSPDGTIQSAGGNIPLGIVYHANANDLINLGNGLYEADGQAPVNARTVPGLTYEIKQGMLEGSNVDITQTMTEMMNTYRNFELNQQVLKAYDKSMDIAVNQIARIR
jgi:flagellar basal-body rod protein FlgF